MAQQHAVHTCETAILGGGIVGVSTAYFLAQKLQTGVVVVEQQGVGCAASGSAGGFLARGWASSIQTGFDRPIS